MSSYQSPFLSYYNSSSSDGEIPDIESLQAVVINGFQVLVKWKFNENTGSSFDLANYGFTVLRSFSEDDGDFMEVSEEVVDIDEWLDMPQSLMDRWRRYYYKLKVRHIPSGETRTFGHVSIHEMYTPSRISIAIINRFNMYLEKFPVGVLAFAFISRQDGGRCDCWDYVEAQASDAHCPFCLGTGFSIPFSNVPVRFYLGINPDVEQSMVNDGEKDGDDRNGWTTNYPDLKKRDIVYIPGKNNGLYRVVSKQWVAQERAVVGIKQAIRLTPIDRDSPEFSKFNMSNDLDQIREYMEIVWKHGQKTYFGCRTGLPIQPTNRLGDSNK